MVCIGDNADNLKWTKVGGLDVKYMHSNNGHVYVENSEEGLRLIFNNVKQGDQGDWKCTLKEDENVGGKSFNLEVYCELS